MEMLFHNNLKYQLNLPQKNISTSFTVQKFLRFVIFYFFFFVDSPGSTLRFLEVCSSFSSSLNRKGKVSISNFKKSIKISLTLDQNHDLQLMFLSVS